MTFPCCPNLTRHRTFNAGALIGVAISCHHRILHQLVRDWAAEILGVCHQPLHLEKCAWKIGFCKSFSFCLGFRGTHQRDLCWGWVVVKSINLGSREEYQSVAANRAFRVSQLCQFAERYPLPLVFSHAFLCYFCYPKSHMQKNTAVSNAEK